MILISRYWFILIILARFPLLMKRFLAGIFLLTILYQSIGQLGIVAYYQLNKDFIAQTLCENQDKPAMQCEGNCFLSKQLKNLEDKQDAKKPAKDIKAENLVYLPAALQKNQPLLYITLLQPGLFIILTICHRLSSAEFFSRPQLRSSFFSKHNALESISC
jgi:hypothetical protein